MAAYIADSPPEEPTPFPTTSRVYAWIVFALTFGLLLSDYMSRQILNAVFPMLKAEWALSDTQLGSLSSIVALRVGLLTFPLSVVADRWGRVKSIVCMALCGASPPSAAPWRPATARCSSPASASASAKPPTAASASPSSSAFFPPTCARP